MLSAAQIKLIRSLHLQKFRKSANLFLVEGNKMVAELLRSDYGIEAIYATEKWFVKNRGEFFKDKFEVIKISSAELKRISALKTPNDVLALVRIPEPSLNLEAFNNLVLMLDGIADPGNLGTIIRIADWYGIKTVICSSDSVELFNPKVVQATMGSLFRVNVFYGFLPEIFQKYCSVIPIYGATLDGVNIYAKELPEKAVIVIGSESHGISAEVKEKVDFLITIPSFSSAAESLNASVATAVICSEFRRKALKASVLFEKFD
ncbi:MAG: TrmH family RNA methyltransferase [Bacteroidales bacterium]|jgi:TrmH family RNA methyltransferase|nr:RNA methyltransferase [Lentimicrobium sp.]